MAGLGRRSFNRRQRKIWDTYWQNFQLQAGCFKREFDLISLIYVLEHLREPASFLQQVQIDMNRGALLYIEVPDALSFRFKPPDDDIFNSCHLWIFSPETIIRFLRENGFQVFSLQRTKTIRGHYAMMLLGGKM